MAYGFPYKLAASHLMLDHRLAICGTGQWLLERYGMTETNMILSNPYHGERRAGFVGLPLPGVEVRAVPEDDAEEHDSSGAVPSATCHIFASRLLAGCLATQAGAVESP